MMTNSEQYLMHIMRSEKRRNYILCMEKLYKTGYIKVETFEKALLSSIKEEGFKAPEADGWNADGSEE